MVVYDAMNTGAKTNNVQRVRIAQGGILGKGPPCGRTMHACRADVRARGVSHRGSNPQLSNRAVALFSARSEVGPQPSHRCSCCQMAIICRS
jgi:hypothetical protein